MPCPSDPISPLSVYRAFVVQFRAATRIESGRVMGRVEHIASLTATDFDTLEDLLAFFNQMMPKPLKPCISNMLRAYAATYRASSANSGLSRRCATMSYSWSGTKPGIFSTLHVCRRGCSALPGEWLAMPGAEPRNMGFSLR